MNKTKHLSCEFPSLYTYTSATYPHGTIQPVSKRIVVACLACSFLIFFLAGTVQAQDADLVVRLLAAINAPRISAGLPPYALNSLLTASAQKHSEYQASIGTFTHVGPDGSRTLERALAAGYPAIRANENIFSGNTTPEEVAYWWLTADADHRNNMLHPVLREIGLGIAADQAGTLYFTMDISAQPNVLPVFINSDAYSTASANVTLTLTNEDVFTGGPGQIGHASQVMVSNSPDFSGASPQGWAQYIDWALDPGTGAGLKIVYVRFIDTAGRTADSQDSIVYDPSGSNSAPAILATAMPAGGSTEPPVQFNPAPTATVLPQITGTQLSPTQPVAELRPTQALDFSGSAYHLRATSEAVTPGLPPATTFLGISSLFLQRMLWGTLATGAGAMALGTLLLVRSRQSTIRKKEHSPDGED